MRYLKIAIILICCFDAKDQINAANVTFAAQQTSFNFGILAPGSTTGSIGSSTSSCSPLTGGVTNFGTCNGSSFSVTALNTLLSPTLFRVYVSQFATTLTTNDTELFFGAVTGCTTISSPPSGFKGMDCTNPSGLNVSKTWTIPVNGVLSNISPTQVGTTVTPSYVFAACGCNILNCPNSATASSCSGSDGKTLNVVLLVRIYKTLSVTQGAALDFGSFVASSSAGTINQSGSTTGGVTAVSSSRSAGSFTVSGEQQNGIAYSFSLPATATLSCDTGTTTSCSGAPNMTATLSFSAGSASRTLNASGQDVVTINGSLAVGANQLSGVYKGTYNVTVNY